MEKWVIVVDDDILNLKVAGYILSRNDMRVTSLSSGKELLDCVAGNGTPDLIPGRNRLFCFQTDDGIEITPYALDIPLFQILPQQGSGRIPVAEHNGNISAGKTAQFKKLIVVFRKNTPIFKLLLTHNSQYFNHYMQIIICK